MTFGLWNKKSTRGEGKPSVAIVLTRNWSSLKGKLSPRRDKQLPDIRCPQNARDSLKAIMAERPLEYPGGESKPSAATVAEKWFSGKLAPRSDPQLPDTSRARNAQDYLKAIIAERPLEYPRGESKPSVATVAEGKWSSLKGEASPQRDEQPPPQRPLQNIQDALRDRLREPRSGAFPSHVLTVRAASPVGWSSRLGEKAKFCSHPQSQLSSKTKGNEPCTSDSRSSESWSERDAQFYTSTMDAERRDVLRREHSGATTKVKEPRRAEVDYAPSRVALPSPSPSIPRKIGAVVEGTRTTSAHPPISRCAPKLRDASSKSLSGFRKEVRSGPLGHCQSHSRSSGTVSYFPPRERAIHRAVDRAARVRGETPVVVLPPLYPSSCRKSGEAITTRDRTLTYRPGYRRTTPQAFNVSPRQLVDKIKEAQLPEMRPAPFSSLRTNRSGLLKSEDVFVALPPKQTAVHLPRGNTQLDGEGEGYESCGSTDSDDSDRTIRPSRISFSSQCTGHNGKASYRPCTERTRPPTTLRRGPQQPHLGLCYHTPQVSETEIRRRESGDRSNIPKSRQVGPSTRDT
ncbi:hypothetical protein FRC01_009246, partial [Tulasnella sp. 417]